MANFEAERNLEREQIRNRLQEIRETLYAQREPIRPIEACITGPGKGPDAPPKSGWKRFEVLQRWGGFDQTTWFRMTVKVPDSMKGRRVVALVRPRGESLAYVNGTPFQGLDDNRDELHLAEKAKGGEHFAIALESVPSVRFDEFHHFEYADLVVMNPLVWDFWWDCVVVQEVLETLQRDTAARRRLHDLLNASVKKVDLQHVNQPGYFDSIAKAQRFLRKELERFEATYETGKLTLVAQSHIDTAWLWPLRETKRKCARTFSTALNLMERHPDYRYMCSQPAQYEWMKTLYPEIYRRIKQRVKDGRWEPCGALWVESDCNIPSGESFVRQLLYGNRFFRSEFGVHSRIAYLPDTFGYNWALPQIFKKAQVDTFVTTKLSWSQFTDFPYGLFQWEGADGTRILGFIPGYTYTSSPTPKQCLDQWEWFKQKDRVDELPFLYGYGDGGGGPTAADIERARRMKSILGIPRCEIGRLQDCVDRIGKQAPFDTLPVWNGELYLERHRGCQTTQARTKRNNRKCECLLHDAEFLNALALLNGASYEHEALNVAWKTVLTHQFHDILPGSSITEVYAQTDLDYDATKAAIQAARDKAIGQLVQRMDTQGQGAAVVVFNTLSWVRTAVVSAKGALPAGAVGVLDPAGAPVPCQRIGPEDELLFLAEALPPLGYAVYRVVTEERSASAGMLEASKTRLENEYLRVAFDDHGRLTSVYDKMEGREVIPKGQRGNVLQLFDDRPRGDDAWDVDFNFEENMWEPAPAERIDVVENGPVRAVVRIVRKTEKSTITQDVTLEVHSPRVDFVTTVDWREKRTLLKVAFPVDVRTSRATYEIQFATIERATHRNMAFDQARFEVPAQRWADLSEGDYGVSLLNDCKYGYDIKDNVMRLSLLRSPVDPDPKADQGLHEFTYSLYPHAWGWRSGAVQQAAELNSPVLGVAGENAKGTLPAVGSLASVDAENVIVATVKRHEDSDALVVRLYEAYGQRGDATLTFSRKPKKVTECDLMEENDTPVKLDGNSVKFFIKPYEIRTFKVRW